MSEYPYTIDNGGGEQLTFVGIGHDERGEHLPHSRERRRKLTSATKRWS
jgi:hypothetical protein